MWDENVTNGIGYCLLTVEEGGNSIATLFVEGDSYSFNSNVNGKLILQCPVEAENLQEAEAIVQKRIKEEYKIALEQLKDKVERYEHIFRSI